MEPYRTNRWRGIVAVALGTLSIGLIATEPSLVLLAVVAVGFAVSPHLLPPPPTPHVDIERLVSPLEPSPGEAVTVELSIHNEGQRTIPDLRVVDGVPPLAAVVDGSPRIATSLRPGESTSVSYVLEVESGKHRFAPTLLVTRNVGGSMERTGTVETPTVIDCTDRDVPVPLAPLVAHRPGPIPANDAGVGVEFYGTREALPSEAIDRIDWRRFARTGDLIAVQFRPDRAANVVLCVDPIDRSGVVSAPDLAVRSLTVVDRIVDDLAADNHAIGLAVPGADGIWIPPGLGRNHVERIRTALDTDPTFVPPGPAVGRSGVTDWNLEDERATAGPAIGAIHNTAGQWADLDGRIGPHDQVIVVSPLLDERMFELALACHTPDAERVTVISPEPRTTDELGFRLSGLVRDTRIRALRSEGIRVFAWSDRDSLPLATHSWIAGETVGR